MGVGVDPGGGVGLGVGVGPGVDGGVGVGVGVDPAAGPGASVGVGVAVAPGPEPGDASAGVRATAQRQSVANTCLTRVFRAMTGVVVPEELARPLN